MVKKSKILKSLETSIRGFKFNHCLLNDQEFERTHKDSNNVEAITIWPTKSIHYKASKLNIENIRHEIFHAFLYAGLTESACLSSLELEEVMAEVFAHFGPEMLKQADFIFRRLS